MTDWADEMAGELNDTIDFCQRRADWLLPLDAAEYLRKHCIPISWVKEWLEALEGAERGFSGIMAEAAVKDRLREILGDD